MKRDQFVWPAVDKHKPANLVAFYKNWKKKVILAQWASKRFGFFFLRVNGGSDKIHKVLKPFSVADVRGPQVFQAVRKAKDVTVEGFMIGRLLLSATDAFGCI